MTLTIENGKNQDSPTLEQGIKSEKPDILSKTDTSNDILSILNTEEYKSIDNYRMEYNYGDMWGLTDTPSTRNAQGISIQINSKYPHILTNAISNILTDVFDNVVNYGMLNGKAEADIEVRKVPGFIVISVANKTYKLLPPTIKDKVFTSQDTAVRVPENELNKNTGGGNGVPFIIKSLKHIYVNLINTKKTPTISWVQGEGKVIFNLIIPDPEDSELVKYKDYMSRKKEEERCFELASKYIIITKNPDGSNKDYDVSFSSEEALPILIDALKSKIAFPEGVDKRFFEIVNILKTIEIYGVDVSSDIFPIILNNYASIHGIMTILEIEKESGMYCNYFSDFIKESDIKSFNSYKKEEPIMGIIKYFGVNYNRAPKEKTDPLKEQIIRCFAEGVARHYITQTFIELDYSLMPLSEIILVLKEILANDSDSLENNNNMNVVERFLNFQSIISGNLKIELEKIANKHKASKVSNWAKDILKTKKLANTHKASKVSNWVKNILKTKKLS